MTDERKARNDSTEEQTRMMVAAVNAKPIQPPEHVPLDDEDMPFFENVIAEFARSEWTQHQLELAAMLARNMADLTREMIELREEGSVTKTDKGTPVVNPRKTVVQMYAGTILSFRRSLALHARGKSGDNRDTGRQREVAKNVEENNPLGPEYNEEDLLATPMGNG